MSILIRLFVLLDIVLEFVLMLCEIILELVHLTFGLLWLLGVFGFTFMTKVTFLALGFAVRAVVKYSLEETFVLMDRTGFGIFMKHSSVTDILESRHLPRWAQVVGFNKTYCLPWCF